MCALFNKKNPEQPNANNSNLSGEDKKKIIEQMYGLGFEVGYHRHSEMGWIKESYTKLLDSAVDDNPFKVLLNNYYIKGKTDGLEKKKLDLRTHSTVAKKETNESISHIEQTSFIDESRSSNRAARQYAPTAHASVTSKPSVVDKPIVVDLPQSLSGFRPLKPYKEKDE